MCTIATAKVQLNYNCYNVYFNGCLHYNCYNVYFNECLRLSRMEPSSLKDETFILLRGKVKVSSLNDDGSIRDKRKQS